MSTRLDDIKERVAVSDCSGGYCTSCERHHIDGAITDLLRVADAARDALNHGAHEGDCDNGYRDERGEWVSDWYDTCSRHIEASKRRRSALAAALAPLLESSS